MRMLIRHGNKCSAACCCLQIGAVKDQLSTPGLEFFCLDDRFFTGVRSHLALGTLSVSSRQAIDMLSGSAVVAVSVPDLWL